MTQRNKDIIIEEFLHEIRMKFPEVSEKLDEWMEIQGWEPEDKMYAAIMEQFSQITTDAFKEYFDEKAKGYLEYMSLKLENANEIEREYIDTYFVESLMWDVQSGTIRKRCWNLMPKNLQELYSNFWGRKLF